MLDRVKTNYGFKWGFVAGKFEPGENAKQCAKRELLEELELKDIKLHYLKKIKKIEDNQDFYHYYYYSTISEKLTINYQKSEIKKVKWFEINKLPKNRAPDDIQKIIRQIKELEK